MSRHEEYDVATWACIRNSSPILLHLLAFLFLFAKDKQEENLARLGLIKV